MRTDRRIVRASSQRERARRFRSSRRRPLDIRTFGRFLEDQGRTNGCGTTSLAMLMSFWKNRPGAYTRNAIDASIRRFNGPTVPMNIVAYLRSQGFRAEAHANASIDDMRRYLDLGVPVEVLYDPDANPRSFSLHYVDVVGYRADAQGAIVSFQIADPAGGLLHEVPVGELQRRWANLKVANLTTGLNNLMIVALPGKNTPVRGRDGVVRSTKDMALPSNGNAWGWQARVAGAVSNAANRLGKATDAMGAIIRRLL